MKVGDLVKMRFRLKGDHGAPGIGTVVDIFNTTCVYENRLATILWGTMGRVSSHRFVLLKVMNESR